MLTFSCEIRLEVPKGFVRFTKSNDCEVVFLLLFTFDLFNLAASQNDHYNMQLHK